MKNKHIAHLFTEKGPIAGLSSSYEYREGQVRMAEMVQQAFDQDQVCVVEAGTGIGKSYAYLVPIFQWCSNHQEERVVIATSTIHLQHQLYEKDIPFLIDALNMPIQATVLKGRANYVCKRRLFKALGQQTLFGEPERDTISQLIVWSNQTESGDKADLPFTVTRQVWGRVCSDADSCMGYRCQFRETCFVMKARQKANESQIIIVNHHLLFADMMLKQGDEENEHTVVLPKFNRLVIDEAHNIEKNATSYFTESYDSRSLAGLLYTLLHTRQNKIGGLLESLRSFSQDPMAFNAIYSEMLQLRAEMDLFDTRLDEFIGKEAGSYYITESRFGSYTGIKDAFAELSSRLDSFLGLLDSCLESCEEEPEIIGDLYEAQTIRMKLKGFVLLLGHYLAFDLAETHVYWIDSWTADSGTSHITVKLTPVEYSELLREGLFNEYDTTVCTSATLTVQNRFDYWEQKVGLSDSLLRDYVKESIVSPFDYRNRVLLCVPKDAPEPSDYGEYFTYSAESITQMLSVAEGGALVLFTSYTMLNDMFDAVSMSLGAQGIRLLRQGDQDRYKLMKEFVEDEHSVLFATQSFWEGVDAPGNTLRLLILCRIPFSVPTEPIFYARKLMIEKEGKSSFYELSLPDAIIKMKQGFGRLMRTSEDRGVVCMLDSRMVRKNYGKTVLASLPQTQVYVSSLPRIIDRMEDFLYKK